MYTCGIDIGTTHIKLFVFDEKFRTVHSKRVRTPITVSESGDVITAESLRNAVYELLNSIPEKIKESLIGVGISSLGETVFPVSEDGSVLGDGLMWYSEATKEDFEDFMKRIDPSEVFEKTGLWPSWIFSIFKMMNFYRKNSQRRNEKLKWLDVASFVAWMLTGDISMDRSLSSRTLLMNVKTGEWDEDLIEISGVPYDHLPRVVDCGKIRGMISKDVSEELGLKRDIVVTTAGHDHITAAYAVGVFEEKRVLNSSGTTETVLWGIERGTLEMIISRKPRVFQMGFHAVPKRYYVLGGLPTGGFCIDWILKILNLSYDDLAGFRHVENSVFFFPYLRGGFAESKIGATFINLRDSDDRNVIISAVMESLAFEMREYMDLLKDHGLPSDVEMIVVGGGTRLRPLLQVKAGVFGLPLRVPAEYEATSLGSAMMVAESLGIFQNVHEMIGFEEVIEPENSEYFDEKYREYLRLKNEIYRG